MTGRPRLIRTADWAAPVPPHPRQVLRHDPDPPRPDAPPLLFLPDQDQPVDDYAAGWLPHAARRGHCAALLTPRSARPPRTAAALRVAVHDAVQAAVTLPRRAVLCGFGAGALVARYAMARYPAAAVVLLSPPRPGRWRRLRLGAPEAPAGRPRVVVAGCPDDPHTSAAVLAAAAARHGGGPLLFPGRSGDLLAGEAGLAALDAILDRVTGRDGD